MDISSLTNQAKANLERAYATLGARPGPGYDIVILPTNPISANWQVEPRTECGKRWLARNRYAKVLNPRALAIMKREAGEFGLSYHTDWSCVVSAIGDP